FFFFMFCADTEPERHALIEKVYPSLYRFCKEKGYEFRMFDLRWGVKDGVSNSNNLMALHLETLKQCQESEGLNFVLFSGQKHDAPVVPEAISRFQSNAPKSAVEYEKDTGLLCQWYKLDENSIPGVYRLQPVSKDPLRRQQAKNKWLDSSKKLYTILQEYAPMALGAEAASQLLRTAQRPWPTKGKLSEQEYHLMSNIKLPILLLQLRYTNICEYTVCWGRNGIDPLVNRSHSYYIEQVCSDFQKAVLNQLNNSVVENCCSSEIKEKLLFIAFSEFIFCLSRAKSFMGRQPVLLDLKDRVWFSNRKVIVVHGETGSGKSTIIAKAALLANGWIPGAAVQIVVRFVGVTGESRNIRLLLQSLCFQIAEIYDVPANFSEDFHELLNEFISLLEFATENKPLMLWLDGLDELSVDYGTNILWLPSELPEHVYVIVSTTTESNGSFLPMLQTLTVEENILQIPQLRPSEADQIISSWLEKDSRRLTANQQQLLMESCLACPTPLYLQCAYNESCQWTSFTSSTDIYLPANLHKLYSWILARLEKEHGEQVVKKTATLITLCRNGITLDELLDLLSIDQTVMQEIQQYQSVSVSRFPLILWLKLQRDLGCHVVEQRTDNTYVFNWTHS
uniref:Uncharacterized protein n=1 Tax=Latimeria chalumnae TaxID=7897 RepID=H3AUK7_LATCH